MPRDYKQRIQKGYYQDRAGIAYKPRKDPDFGVRVAFNRAYSAWCARRGLSECDSDKTNDFLFIKS